MRDLRLPAFLIIGASRSGTSSLWKMLGQHPLLLPAKDKEPHFFDNLFNKKTLDWYVSLWRGDRCSKSTRPYEATPAYLYHSEAPIRIKSILPWAKFIVLLRNPVDRTWSQFYPYINEIDATPEWLMTPNNIGIRKSLYAMQLKRWFFYFPEERFLIIKSEDFFKDNMRIANECLSFLGLSEFDFKSEYYDPLEWRKKKWGKPEIPENIKVFLTEYFRTYNKKLYGLLGRDFGWENGK